MSYRFILFSFRRTYTDCFRRTAGYATMVFENLFLAGRLLHLIFTFSHFLLVLLWCSVSRKKRRAVSADLQRVSGNPNLTDQDFEDHMLTFGHILQVFHSRWLDVFKIASLHKKAPNPRIYSLETGSKNKLLDLQTKGRPLVLNFGSCT